jgi:hypothetical protein
MPAIVAKEGAKWVVRSHRGGRVLGRHDSESAAKKQQRAVNASLSRAGKI